MAQDWRPWLETAEHELREARGSLGAGSYQSAAFFSHQAAEVALKALWMHEADGLPPRTHNLVDMAEHLEAPKEILPAARDLNPLYSATRDPDVANGNPGKNYDEANASRAIAGAEEVFQWCSRRLRS